MQICRATVITDRTGRPMTARGPAGDRIGRVPDLALQAATLTLRHAAPDTEPLVVLECVLQALGPYLAAAAHPLGLPGRSSLLREERLRIRLRAQCPVLPAQFVNLIRADEDLR